MKTTYTIKIAPTALWSLRDAESWKSFHNDPVSAAQWVDELLQTSIAAIAQDPKRYHHNVMMADKGLLIRERLSVEQGARCLYDVDEETKTVEILLFVSMKQDLLSMFYRYVVLN